MTIHSTPEPAEPVPLVRPTPAPVPYPVTALGPLKEAALGLHDITQAPIAICAQSLLGVASLAVQGLVDAETLHGRSPSSLSLLTVAQSGERKSTCDRLAMQPVRAFEQELADARRIGIAGYRNRREIWEVDRKRILNSKQDRVAKEVDLEALGPEPTEPLYASIISAEPTLEGITKNMPLLRASLGIFSDEGGAFLGGHGMSSENRLRTIAGLSRLWDGTAVERVRASEAVNSFPGRRVSMHLMAQPIVADEVLADPLANGQGLLARCLITEPPSAIGTRTRVGHEPESDQALEQSHARILELLRSPLPVREGVLNELDPPLHPLSEEARSRLQAFAIRVEEEQIAGGKLETVRGFASKASEHAARLAAVLSVFAGEEEISGQQMSAAITLARYYVCEALRLTNGASVSRDTSDAEKMRLWLAERWGEAYISVTDAVQYGPGSLRETKVVVAIFAVLQRYGYLLPCGGGATIRGQRRRHAWTVVRAAVAH